MIEQSIEDLDRDASSAAALAEAVLAPVEP
jgi:hypothetical protein